MSRLSNEPTVRYVYSMPASHMKWLTAQAKKADVSVASLLRALVDKARKVK
jgi:hypothetical protein